MLQQLLKDTSCTPKGSATILCVFPVSSIPIYRQALNCGKSHFVSFSVIFTQKQSLNDCFLRMRQGNKSFGEIAFQQLHHSSGVGCHECSFAYDIYLFCDSLDYICFVFSRYIYVISFNSCAPLNF